MYTKRTVAPLTINTRSNADGKAGGFAAAAAFRYTEQPVTSTSRRRGSVNRPPSRQAAQQQEASQRRQRSNSQSNSVTNYQTQAPSPPAMFVQALYDYDADDRTSLSFRQGDVIQVITQLKSGWWDGIINDVRGWFPSNYCAVVPGPTDKDGGQSTSGNDDVSGESGTDDDLDEEERAKSSAGAGGRGGSAPSDGQELEQEAAAFWIPQATPDGRLFYYNTLTGVSTMELPLEGPTDPNETGPHDRMNARAPDQTRPPPERMANGLQRNEDDDGDASTSESDSLAHSKDSLPRRRRSYVSDGVSPAASMESLNASPLAKHPNDSRDFQRQPFISGPGMTTSFTGNYLGQCPALAIPRSFFDDGTSPPVTWNRLVENMRKSIESYRRAINNADRSEYVRRAEDISDHLRMVLAAGSSTTDNHSGNPSVISTNKALYPHFRDMMSRFSKLVLSSHIAAADWPAPDSYSKCLQEADGVLQGVYGFVEVARAQRGEEIARIVPGFVVSSHQGGSWQNNSVGPQDVSSFMDQDDHERLAEPLAKLDSRLLERIDELKRMVVSSIRKLDEHLVVTEKVVNPMRHEQISNSICAAAGKVVDHFRSHISMLESIDLSQTDTPVTPSQINDFSAQKQRLYDLIAGLVVACQTVAGPLSDEWADVRGEPLGDRVQDVRSIANQLEVSMSQAGTSLHLLLQHTSSDNAARHREANRKTENFDSPRLRGAGQRSDFGQSAPFSEFADGTAPPSDAYRDNPKLKRFFGVAPSGIPSREAEETPPYLKLDHENEIAYDMKVEPPQLRGGTLTALVEQLTRHDRLDAPFNNTFLLTYRSFTSATELFEMLVKRFSVQPPRGISQDNYRSWVDKKQKPIRFRVVNILKSWFDSHWMEGNDEASNELLRRVYSFAKDSVATSSTPGSGPLMTVVEQRLRGLETTSKRLVLNLSTQAPAPIIPKNMKKLKFLDIDATEFARQLTIIESKLYGKIKPTECLNKTWQKKVASEESEPAPNVKALILHSNQLTNWVAEMILTQTDVKKRVVVIKHFVSVADVSHPFEVLFKMLNFPEMPIVE